MTNVRRCDLHMHTLHSDGTYTSTELVRMAKSVGLACIAVTDHDTLSGIAEAQEEGNKLGIEVISGVEISVICDPGTMHILGYFIDRNSKQLNEKLEDIQEARRQRNPMIIEKLQALGMKITLEEVEKVSGGDQVGRPHFARVLIDKGYVKDSEEAFNKYLTKGAPAYIDKRKLTSQDAINMIEEAGGVASLAHPKQLKLDSKPDEFERVIANLRDQGMKGLEVYSSCQNREEAARYKKTAERLGLIVTGGSDFHGGNKPSVKLGWMGSDEAHIPYETIDRMKKHILDRKVK